MELILILAGVDVCLGPLLTLIVWDVKKPKLWLDMAIIVLIQLNAMGYGLRTIYLARPVYMVFSVDRFDLVAVPDISMEEMKKFSYEEYKTLPLTGVKVVAAKMPTDVTEKNELMFSALAGGADLPQSPHYYAPYAELAPEAARKAKPLDALTQRDAATRDKLSAYLSSHDLDPAKVKFLPMRAKAHDQTVLVDADTGAVLGIVNIDPWVQ
ncbi:fimb protein [Methylomagnum ishizawai]|nr:fimb protein [Methylomagnum ishizawai]